jgi:hypothetical protein
MIGKGKLQTDAVNKPDVREAKEERQLRNLPLIRMNAGLVSRWAL